MGIFKRRRKEYEATITPKGIEVFLYLDDIMRGKEVEANMEVELNIYEIARKMKRSVDEAREIVWRMLKELYEERFKGEN